MIHPELADLMVPIDSVQPHPENPRRADVGKIAKSLAHHGQFRPIVVQASTRYVLGGNHTLLAARSLGFESIAAVMVDVDDQTARRIMLADNRHAELAFWNEPLLVDVLRSLSDLEGTGWDEQALAALEAQLAEGSELNPADPKPREKHPLEGASIIKATYGATAVDDDALAACIAALPNAPAEARETVRAMLELPADTPRRRKGRNEKVPTGAAPVGLDRLRVPIDSIRPHPDNPRAGDTGSIITSMAEFGQFRPVLVNRRDNTILAGTHTWFAARILGWESVAITTVDVDEDTAVRILIADNRTAEGGSYDTDTLVSLLSEVGLDGTGYSPEDLDALTRGRPDDAGVKPSPKGAVSLICPPLDRKVTARCDFDAFGAWWDSLGDEPLTVIAGRLGIPHAALLGAGVAA